MDLEELLELAAAGELNNEEVEELLIINLAEERQPPRMREEQYGPFNLNDINDVDVVLNFRFKRHNLEPLRRALRIPDTIRTDDRHTVSGLTGLCMYLRRLAYPNRLSDLEPMFGLSGPYLSDVCSTVMNIINNNYGHLLTNLRSLTYLNLAKLNIFAQDISQKGAQVENCWGFIDGTTRGICRPTVNQENYFSGHKRFHCVKYQAVMCPDGITASCLGPFEGRRHDAGVFRQTNFYRQLEECVVFPNGQQFVLYGDQAYGIRELLLSPYSNRNLTPDQQLFNNSMKVVRQAVEWGFGNILSEFAFLDFKKNQKLVLQNVGTMYKTATILMNCHTCLYGSQTSSYFNVQPPTLEEYLGL